MTAIEKKAFETCKGCKGTGYKEGVLSNGTLEVSSRWRCFTCDGQGKIGLPDYPLRCIPLDMYKCGYCGKFNQELGICRLGVHLRLEYSRPLPTDTACFRIHEFFVGGSFVK